MAKEKSKKSPKSLSTQQRTIIIVVVLGLIFFLVLSSLGLCGICAFLTSSTEESSESQKEEEVAGAATETPSEVTVEETYKVTDVVDGDTIKIYYEGKKESVRLIGIDTQESEECFNQKSNEFVPMQ